MSGIDLRGLLTVTVCLSPNNKPKSHISKSKRSEQAYRTLKIPGKIIYEHPFYKHITPAV